MGKGHKLAGFSYIYNGVKFDIPFIQSIESVIDVVDEFVLAECYSEDETWELCQQLSFKYPNKIKLVRHAWVKHYSELRNLANWASHQTSADISYIMELQSDECIHEKDLEELSLLPEKMSELHKDAARWKYLHFLGGPTITFPFCYDVAVRVVKKNTPWVVIGDGVQFAFGGRWLPDPHIITSNIEVFHYGKMKAPDKGHRKEVAFQNLFTDIGFPDPKMEEMVDKLGKEYCDYVYLFRDHFINKTIRRYEGVHPKVMLPYIEAFKSAGFEQLVSQVERSLKAE